MQYEGYYTPDVDKLVKCCACFDLILGGSQCALPPVCNPDYVHILLIVLLGIIGLCIHAVLHTIFHVLVCSHDTYKILVILQTLTTSYTGGTCVCPVEVL